MVRPRIRSPPVRIARPRPQRPERRYPPPVTAKPQPLGTNDTKTPRLQHGDGQVTWVLLRDAVRRGLDTRVGFEDTLRGPDCERTTGNEALVRAARELGAV